MSGRYNPGRRRAEKAEGRGVRGAAEESRELGVVELRRIRAQVEALPPGPWKAVELSDFELHGPHPWDQDVEPSRAAHERREAARRQTAAWRGVRAADGTLVAGEPVAGGSPQRVIDEAWLFLADARTDVPRLLATLRTLWHLRDQDDGTDSGLGETPSTEDPLPPPSRIDVERVATVLYEAVPAPTRWRELPELVRDEWRARAAAAVHEVMDNRTG